MFKDIIYIATAFSRSAKDTPLFKLSASCAIIHVLVKPIQTLILHQVYKERGGEYGFNIGRVLPGHNYENIGTEDEAESFVSNTYKVLDYVR